MEIIAADEAAIVGKVAQLKKDVKDAMKNVKEVRIRCRETQETNAES